MLKVSPDNIHGDYIGKRIRLCIFLIYGHQVYNLEVCIPAQLQCIINNMGMLLFFLYISPFYKANLLRSNIEQGPGYIMKVNYV